MHGPRPWRRRPGVVVKDGELILPAGATELLDLAQSSGWRYELRFGLKSSKPVELCFGATQEPDSKVKPNGHWHAYRLQGDLTEKRGFLSRDGQRTAEFALEHPPGKAVPFSLRSEAPVTIRDLAFIDYRQKSNVEQPFEPVVLADDDFRAKPSVDAWPQIGYDDSHWLPADLPCVHGGFREAGEDLFLRRSFEVPGTARRILLEVEALDPSGEIHVNGKLAASIPNRLPVFLDISKLVKPGANVLAFKVNHNSIEDPMHHCPADPATGWFAGRTTLHLLSGDVSIRELLVHTASLGEQNHARQIHRLRFENSGNEAFSGTVEISYSPWFPQDGPPAGTQSIPVAVGPAATQAASVELDLSNASVWSPDQPHLYAVTATLRDATGKAIDDVATSAGVRTVAQKAGQLLLNGKPALLIGAQNMGFRPVPDFENCAKYNRCAPAAMLMSELLAVRNMGGSVFRVHVHSASNKTGGINDPRIAEMADQVGMPLFWTGPAWVREGDERTVDTVHAGEYMRQVFNHPSIINWELGNHPNKFKEEDSPRRTDDFVRKTVQAVLAVDTSRLITPTTYWKWTHYGNDLGTVDHKGRPITPVPEYTHPLVTRGGQDAITGYGAEWTALRKWPEGKAGAADCMNNRIRAWFNFEHEESGAQPNWNLSSGSPWHRLRSYESGYEKGSIGRVLDFSEWRASQGWQAFSAYESMRKQIWHGVAAFSWCTIEGGANSGTYEKPLLDPFGHAKLAWHIHKMLAQPVLAGSDNVDTVYGPTDSITPCVFNLGPERTANLTITVETSAGQVIDERKFPGLHLERGRSLLKLPAFRPKLPDKGHCVIKYTVTP